MSSWVNRTVLSGSSVNQNGTNSHTVSFAAATSGNFLVAVVAGAVTSSTPTGWTLATSAVNNTGIYVFTKTASGGESSFTTTHNSSDHAIRGVVYEFPSGTSVIGTDGETGQTIDAPDTGMSVSGLSGTYTRMAARSYALNNTTSTAAVAWTLPGTEDYDAYTPRSGGLDGVSLSIAYDDGSTGTSFTSTSTLSQTNTTTSSGEGVAWALSIGSGSSNVATYYWLGGINSP